jgi:hypothetical protein
MSNQQQQHIVDQARTEICEAIQHHRLRAGTQFKLFDLMPYFRGGYPTGCVPAAIDVLVNAGILKYDVSFGGHFALTPAGDQKLFG